MRRAALLFLAACSLTAAAVPDAPTDSAASRLNEVVVTGTNGAVGRSLLPYSVSVVPASQLEATGSNRVLSAVSGLVPSLFVSERNILGFGVSNGGAGHIKLRGVGGDRASAVLMMVDGQPQFAGIYSHGISDFYQTEYVERVEVLRGPASVLYGSNAMAGVINVITKHVRRDGLHATLTSQYGSHNTWLSALTATARYGRFSSLVSLGYDRTDGLRKNFDFLQSSAYANVAYEISPAWTVRADWQLMEFVGNDPVYPTLSNPASTDIYHQDVIRGEASVMASNRYGSTDGAIRLYYSYGNHYIDDPRHFHSLDDRLGAIVYQNFSPWSGAGATAGFDFDRYTGRIPVSGGNAHRPGSLSTLSRKTVNEYSPYVTLAQTLFDGRLTLDAGLRMANSDRFGTRWVPQAGFTVRPGLGWHLKGSIAHGYRNPSFRELYLYRMANPDLKPEDMINYELTLGKSLAPWLDIDLTAYLSDGSDMIQVVDMKNVNTGSFINKGIEVSARSHPVKTLSLHASYSFLHSSVRDLTAAPRHQYYLGAGWDAFPRFHADATLKGVAGLFVADGIHRQNYATLDLHLSYQIIRQLQVFLNLDNIIDARYTINRGYPMPGITALAGLKLSL